MRNIFLFVFLSLVVFQVNAQDHDWAFGFYGDIHLKSSANTGVFGIQGKYDFANHSALQAQVYGRNGYVAVGADYLFFLLNRATSNFNVFLGGGVSQDFYRYHELSEETLSQEKRENFTVMNGQAGVSYYFPDLNLSLYTGYKLKYNFDWEETQPNYLMLGIRYHLW